MNAIRCTKCGEQLSAPVNPGKWRHRTITTPCRCKTMWVFVYNDDGRCVGYHAA